LPAPGGSFQKYDEFRGDQKIERGGGVYKKELEKNDHRGDVEGDGVFEYRNHADRHEVAQTKQKVTKAEVVDKPITLSTVGIARRQKMWYSVGVQRKQKYGGNLYVFLFTRATENKRRKLKAIFLIAFFVLCSLWNSPTNLSTSHASSTTRA
jgi:hypothetical protein